jgi:hypothetical protein
LTFLKKYVIIFIENKKRHLQQKNKNKILQIKDDTFYK